jgi:hypothetical protein
LVKSLRVLFLIGKVVMWAAINSRFVHAESG